MRCVRMFAAGIALAVGLQLDVDPAGAEARLIAHWKMNETSGSIMHDSIASHDGSLHSVRRGVSGFKGTAYGFNGSSSYVTVPSSGLNPGSAKITITIHLKATST